MGFGSLCVNISSSTIINEHSGVCGDINDGRCYAAVGAENMWEIAVSCPQYCCELQMLLKLSQLKKYFEGVIYYPIK